MRIYGICIDSYDNEAKQLKQRPEVSLVMDYYPYSLDIFFPPKKRKRKKRGPQVVQDDISSGQTEFWSRELVLRCAQHIASGMAFIHAKDMIHRDLKPANCLLTKDMNQIVVADFGLSKIARDKESVTGQLGTPAYMASEMINVRLDPSEAGANLPACDVFSYGVLINALWGRERPYENLRISAFDLLLQVGEGRRPAMKDDLPMQMRELLERCWAHVPDQRPAFREIAEILQRDDFRQDFFGGGDGSGAGGAQGQEF